MYSLTYQDIEEAIFGQTCATCRYCQLMAGDPGTCTLYNRLIDSTSPACWCYERNENDNQDNDKN